MTPGPRHDDTPRWAIRMAGELSVATARPLCQAIERAFAAGRTRIWLDLERVKSSDVAGLAALLQATERTEALGGRLTLTPSESLHAALLRAQLLDEIVMQPAAAAGEPAVDIVIDASAAGHDDVLARSARISLRQPRWDELPLFTRWANDPLLDQMVGSELLYSCRHLGPHHPEVVGLVTADPTSLTLLVEPPEAPGSPVGFVRLYDIHLVQRFAFLETAVASVASLRKGWGVEASRLLLAWAMDVLGLERVEAKVYAYNVLSANALRRNGFQPEGVLRRARRYHGQRWDIHVFSILASEMQAQRRCEDFGPMGPWTRPTPGKGGDDDREADVAGLRTDADDALDGLAGRRRRRGAVRAD